MSNDDVMYVDESGNPVNFNQTQNSEYLPSVNSFDAVSSTSGEVTEQLARWLADPTKEIEQIEHILKGEVWNDEDKLYIKETDPLMNKRGVSFIIGFMKPRMQKNELYSNFSERKIATKCKHADRILSRTLMKKWKDFGIKDTAYVYHIHDLVMNTIWSASLRALNQSEKIFAKGIHREVVRTEPSKKNDSKWWSPFK